MIYCEEFFKIILDKQGGIKTKHRIILLTSKHFQPEKLVKTPNIFTNINYIFHVNLLPDKGLK